MPSARAIGHSNFNLLELSRFKKSIKSFARMAAINTA